MKILKHDTEDSADFVHVVLRMRLRKESGIREAAYPQSTRYGTRYALIHAVLGAYHPACTLVVMSCLAPRACCTAALQSVTTGDRVHACVALTASLHAL